MKLLAILSVVAGLATGQAPVEATLSGRIIDAITRQPLAGATVSYRASGGSSTTSDAKGEYTLHVPKPDPRAFIWISRTGYAIGPTNVPLQPGAAATHDFELSPEAAIHGKIVDRDTGLPLSGFTVMADQRPAFVRTSAPSGSDGSFVVEHLAPGAYILRIDPPRFGVISAGSETPDRMGYEKAWYPNVPAYEMASPVTVAPGEDRKLEVRLQKRTLLSASGTLHVPEELEKDAIWIALHGPLGPVEGSLPQAGPFRIDELTDGPYTVLASTKTTPGHARVFGSATFGLNGHDIENLRVNMVPAVSLRAIVSMAEENVGVPSGLNFFALPLDGWGPETGNYQKERLLLTDLPPGKYAPGLNVPAGFAVASATYGGRPLPPSTAIEVTAPESAVTYVLTTKLGRVAGTVLDKEGKPVANANVWLLPHDLPNTVDQFVILNRGNSGNAKTDATGGFFFDGLAPGRYKVVALEAGVDEDISKVRNMMSSAETITVEAGLTAMVRVVVQ